MLKTEAPGKIVASLWVPQLHYCMIGILDYEIRFRV